MVVGAPALHRDGEALQSFAHLGQHRLRVRGELERARKPAEQRHAQVLLEDLHLVAHRARRHVQLARGVLEAQVARRRLESAQRVQGRKAAVGVGHG